MQQIQVTYFQTLNLVGKPKNQTLKSCGTENIIYSALTMSSLVTNREKKITPKMMSKLYTCLMSVL